MTGQQQQRVSSPSSSRRDGGAGTSGPGSGVTAAAAAGGRWYRMELALLVVLVLFAGQFVWMSAHLHSAPTTTTTTTITTFIVNSGGGGNNGGDDVLGGVGGTDGHRRRGAAGGGGGGLSINRGETMDKDDGAPDAGRDAADGSDASSGERRFGRNNQRSTTVGKDVATRVAAAKAARRTAEGGDGAEKNLSPPLLPDAVTSKIKGSSAASVTGPKTISTATKGNDDADNNSSITNNNKRKKQKRRKNKDKWDPGEDGRELDGPMPIKVKLPIFVPSLPKSGTTSIWQYFNCGGRVASHQWVKKLPTDRHTVPAGECVRDNVAAGLPPFQGCGDYEVFTDTGFATIRSYGPVCYYPSVDALEAIYRHYPDITVIHIVRDTQEWYDSMMNWGEGSLLGRWTHCNATGFPRRNARERDYKRFYDWHTANVRRHASMNPGSKYVEISLSDPNIGAILEREVGIPAYCWGKCTPYSKFCERTTNVTRPAEMAAGRN